MPVFSLQKTAKNSKRVRGRPFEKRRSGNSTLNRDEFFLTEKNPFHLAGQRKPGQIRGSAIGSGRLFPESLSQ